MSDAKPQAIGLKGVGAPSCGFDAADTGRRMRAVLIGSAGNLIEWYDIYASSAFSLYFAGAFFPQFDPLAQQLAAASLFAAALGTVPLLTTLRHTKSPFAAFSSDLRRLSDRQRLHLDRGHRQSRIVSDRGPRHGRRRALRADGGNFRPVGRLGGAQLQNAGFEEGFYWHATVCIFISLICYIFMRDMKTHSKMEQAL